jgi:hypothetical protein
MNRRQKSWGRAAVVTAHSGICLEGNHWNYSYCSHFSPGIRTSYLTAASLSRRALPDLSVNGVTELTLYQNLSEGYCCKTVKRKDNLTRSSFINSSVRCETSAVFSSSLRPAWAHVLFSLFLSLLQFSRWDFNQVAKKLFAASPLLLWHCVLRYLA